MSEWLGVVLFIDIAINIYALINIIVYMATNTWENLEAKLNNLTWFGKAVCILIMILLLPMIIIVWATSIIGLIFDWVGELLNKLCFKK